MSLISLDVNYDKTLNVVTMSVSHLDGGSLVVHLTYSEVARLVRQLATQARRIRK